MIKHLARGRTTKVLISGPQAFSVEGKAQVSGAAGMTQINDLEAQVMAVLPNCVELRLIRATSVSTRAVARLPWYRTNSLKW